MNNASITKMKSLCILTLPLLVLGVLPVTSAVNAATDDVRIVVTTTNDEFGVDPTTCSLREAIFAASNYIPFNGCDKGVINFTAKIFLQPTTYTLTKGELVIDGPGKMRIIGGVNIDVTGDLTANVEQAFIEYNEGSFAFIKYFANLSSEEDYVTHSSPQRRVVETIIDARGLSRVFNTERTKSDIWLEDLKLTNGRADNNGSASGDVNIIGSGEYGYGGMILAGGGVTLTRVIMENSHADADGGAIYLAGQQSTLNMTSSQITNAVALGNIRQYTNEKNVRQIAGSAAVGMSCLSSTSAVKRSININKSSIIQSTGSHSVIDICGVPTVKITNSTIAENEVTGPAASTLGLTEQKLATGELKGAAVIRYVSLGNAAELTRTADLNIENVTLMDNKSDGLFYDGSASLTIKNSVLAFNEHKSCSYYGTLSPLFTLTLGYNAFTGSEPVKELATDKIAKQLDCELPYNSINSDTFYNTSWINAPLLTLFNPLKNYGGWVSGYLPKELGKDFNVIVDKGQDLEQCSGVVDQRGVTRRSGFNDQKLKTSDTPRCDIGALELSKLTANDILGLTNISYYASALIDPINPVEASGFDDLFLEDKLLELVNYDIKQKKIEKLKQYFTYRSVLVPVLSSITRPENVSVEQSGPEKAGVHIVTPLSKTDLADYIKTYSFGSSVNDWTDLELNLNSGDLSQTAAQGSFDENKVLEEGTLLLKPHPSDIKTICTYDPDLEQIIIRREDNSLTPVNQYEHCVYEVKGINGSEPSVGIIQGRIINHAPIIKEDVVLNLPKGGTTLQINEADILKNIVDEGDGPYVREEGSKATLSPSEATYNADRLTPDNLGLVGRVDVLNADGSPKMETINGVEVIVTEPAKVYIKLITQPSLGKLTFEYEGNCPDNGKKKEQKTCYGGNATYTPYNTFNKFDESIQFKVLDKDLGESNTAVLRLNNVVEQPLAAGGLHLFWFAIFAVLGLIRRKLV